VKNLGTLGGANSEARAINYYGEIVGWSETASGATHAFLWKSGVMTDLGSLGGTFSTAEGINRSGIVVGASTTKSSLKDHAFRWKDGVMKDLGTLGTKSSWAAAINTAGQIAGTLGPPKDAVGEEDDLTTPFRYQSGVITPLPRLHLTSSGLGISPTGVVVGRAEESLGIDETIDAWVWENGTIQQLPELADGYASANGINGAGTIVGYSQNASGLFRAVLWRRQ
jgi:probable HAF family extracellular repeat protein